MRAPNLQRHVAARPAGGGSAPWLVLGLLAWAWTTASAGPLVVVDPGHGGAQLGARAPGGTPEKAVALAIARQLEQALERSLGARVVLTRGDDTELSLAARVERANRLRPDVFLSIHANSMPTRAQKLVNEGVETYFLSASASGDAARRVAARENAEGGVHEGGPLDDTLAFILADLQRTEAHADASRLAHAVHDALVAETGAVDRGVHQAPFAVLMGLAAPAILVEVGFISHPEESRRLVDPEYQARLVRGLVAGVRSFLEQVAARDARPEELGRGPCPGGEDVLQALACRLAPSAAPRSTSGR